MKYLLATTLVLTVSLSAHAGNDSTIESIAPVHNMAVEICLMGNHLEGECQTMIKNRTAAGIHFLQQAASLASLENHPASVTESVERCIAATGETESCFRAVMTGNPAADRFAKPSQVTEINASNLLIH